MKEWNYNYIVTHFYSSIGTAEEKMSYHKYNKTEMITYVIGIIRVNRKDNYIIDSIEIDSEKQN